MINMTKNKTITNKKKTATRPSAKSVKKTTHKVVQPLMPIWALIIISIIVIAAIIGLLGTFARDFLHNDAIVRERMQALERERY